MPLKQNTTGKRADLLRRHDIQGNGGEDTNTQIKLHHYKKHTDFNTERKHEYILNSNINNIRTLNIEQTEFWNYIQSRSAQLLFARYNTTTCKQFISAGFIHPITCHVLRDIVLVLEIGIRAWSIST